MPPISSRQNPLVKRIRQAIREHEQEIVIEGPKPVADALASGWTPIAIVTSGTSVAYPSHAEVTGDVFESLSETRHPQGVLGLFRRPTTSAADILARRDALVVALDAVQDPGNVGTIVRLAAAFDAAGVLLLPGCADALGPKAIRSSVGAVLTVPVAPTTASQLLESGRPLFAADASGDPSLQLPNDAVLVLGNEGSGVSAELLRHSTPIAIAMSSRIESLNVASSAAIFLSRVYGARK